MLTLSPEKITNYGSTEREKAKDGHSWGLLKVTEPHQRLTDMIDGHSAIALRRGGLKVCIGFGDSALGSRNKQQTGNAAVMLSSAFNSTELCSANNLCCNVERANADGISR